jgi:retron-type reverse transcriptase
MARNETEQVRQLQRTLYRTAKQSKAVKFYSLFDKVWRSDVLREAWRQVKANRGAPGVDSETIEGIVSRGEEEGMISRLQEQLRAKSYRFQPVRRVDIPKPNGSVAGLRPIWGFRNSDSPK